MQKFLKNVVSFILDFLKDFKEAMVKYSKQLSYFYLSISLIDFMYGRDACAMVMLTFWFVFDIIFVLKVRKKIKPLRTIERSKAMTRKKGGRIEIIPEMSQKAVMILYDLEESLGKHEN